MSNEAFARVRIDALLAAQGWDTLDTNAVRFEVQLPDGTRADYVLCDRHGRSLAVIEAKRYSVSPGDAAAQARAYAQQLGVPYAFLCNGDEVLFWEWQREAYPRPVKTIFKQDDLERRIATQSVRRDPVSVAVEGTTYLGPRLVCAVQGTLPNGATDGATPEAWPYKTGMDAGSAPDWEVMIDHM